MNEHRLQQAVGGVSSIRVGAEPLIYAVKDISARVRIGSPIPVTATFSESVSGFALDDINTTNGAASNLVRSGKVYTFEVTPDAIGEVTVNIPAGSATDHWDNQICRRRPCYWAFHTTTTMTA